MKNKVITVIVLFLFAAGLLVFNYPVISTLYNQIHQGEVIASYDESLERLWQEELDSYWEEAVEYNKKLAETTPSLQDAFSTEKGEENQDYKNVLDMDETGVMGSIEIPDINVYLPIYHGTSSDVLEQAVGHLEGSSVPVGGESTHCILTGHRGLPSAELFTNLDQVEEGDIFYIHILQRTLAYKVRSIEVIEPQNVDHLVIEKNKDLATLVTCTPYGINSHRLLIHGERTEFEEKSVVSAAKAEKQNLWKWLWSQKVFVVSVAIVILILLYGLFCVIRSIRRK